MRPQPHRPTRATLRAAAFAFGLATLLASGAASADPALWRIKSAHATLYLYGTVHVLRPGQQWTSPTVEQALADSKALWLEVPDADEQPALQPLVRSLGLDPTHPLSTKVDLVTLRKIDAAARAAGLPGEQALEPMRPWLASVSLTMLPLVKAGYDPKSGVERKLKAEAIAQGKPVRGLETLSEQLHYFADMPPKTELALLDSTLDEVDKGPERLDALVAAWEAGNVPELDQLTNAWMAQQSPELYALLVRQRNVRWASQLDGLLKADGTNFVAVGTAHLVGTDSVQSQLTRLGYQVERVQ